MNALSKPLLVDDPGVEPDGPQLLLEWESRWQAFISSIRPALRPNPRGVAGEDTPKLLVKWESRWQGFVSSIRPGFGPSPQKLAGEVEAGQKLGRTTFTSLLLHTSVLLFAIMVPARLVRNSQVEPLLPFTERYQFIYYSGQQLPRMTDASGAAMGERGKSGGRQIRGPQVIHIARGRALVKTVVDAPDLKLPLSSDPVANLLIPFNAGPAPIAPSPITSRNSLRSVEIPTHSPVRPPETVTRQSAALRVPAAPHVIPPPMMVTGSTRNPPTLAPMQVVPPPVSAPPRVSIQTASLTLPAESVIAPSPSATRENDSHARWGSLSRDEALNASAAAPSPSPTRENGPSAGWASTSHDVALSASTVGVGAPPGSRGSNTGSTALGSVLNALGSVVGTLKGSGTGGVGSVVVSPDSGSNLGTPNNGAAGSLAMSPAGGDKPGFGGSGDGSGIGVGRGTGNALSGTGTGSWNRGTGLGDTASSFGTSNKPGPGGSGDGSSAPNYISGVTVSKGKAALSGFGQSQPTMPSFAGSSSAPQGSGARSSGDKRNAAPLTVIATSRSGGALNLYGALKGARVYTIYLNTRIGLAVLQYAERAGSKDDFERDLSSPEPLSIDMPEDIPHSRFILSCVIDRTGAVQNLRPLEVGAPAAKERMLDTIRRWRFRPVLRGDEPVEVDVILGFDIDTR